MGLRFLGFTGGLLGRGLEGAHDGEQVGLLVIVEAREDVHYLGEGGIGGVGGGRLCQVVGVRGRGEMTGDDHDVSLGDVEVVGQAAAVGGAGSVRALEPFADGDV